MKNEIKTNIDQSNQSIHCLGVELSGTKCGVSSIQHNWSEQ